MKNIILIFLFFFGVHLYAQTSSRYEFKPQYSIALPSETGKKMMVQCSRSVPEKIEKYFDLTNTDIASLEDNYKKILSIKATECCLQGWKIPKLDDYAFQYVGVVINSRKYIYINAFLIDISYGQDSFKTWHKDWKTKPIIACDGGDGFWGALFDLEKKTFSRLSVNGFG